jgi:hypothetical protein
MESQRGAVKLSVVIAAVLGFGFGASAFLNFEQHQRADQDRKLLQGEIVDLRYQVAQDKQAASPSPSPDALSDIPTDSPLPSASPSAAPSAPPAVLGDSAPAPQTALLAISANLRTAAKSNASLVARVPKGAIATVLDAAVQNGYKHVTINGKTGYILASALQ